MPEYNIKKGRCLKDIHRSAHNTRQTTDETSRNGTYAGHEKAKKEKKNENCLNSTLPKGLIPSFKTVEGRKDEQVRTLSDI